MKKFNATLLAAAAMTGLLSGSAAFAASSAPAPAPTTGSHGSISQFTAGQQNSLQGVQLADGDTGKHDCKGKNGCKGQGGCSSGDNGCKGKNSCKGQGGCNTNKSSS